MGNEQIRYLRKKIIKILGIAANEIAINKHKPEHRRYFFPAWSISELPGNIHF